MFLYFIQILSPKLEPVNCFCSNFITIQRWIQEPHNIYDGALCNNCKRLKAVNYYREVLHLSYDKVHGSASDN